MAKKPKGKRKGTSNSSRPVLDFDLSELVQNIRINNRYLENHDVDVIIDHPKDGTYPGKLFAFNESKKEDDHNIYQPFDPSKIRVSYKEYPIDLVLKRIGQNELKLNPDFQRSADIWTLDAQSRLIESVLIRIPLPVFYIDGSEEDSWIVVDGLQRLNTFKKFALDNSLKLQNLEFLKDLHGQTFQTLPRSLQRRFLETTIGIYLIEKGTPERVKLSIFQRINTGGLPLSSQEIRHAVYQGNATRFLNRLAKSDDFTRIIGNKISKERMADKESLLRATAFLMEDYRKYDQKDLDGFLNYTMSRLQKIDGRTYENLFARVIRSLRIADKISGSELFRKPSDLGEKAKKINRSLFDVWIVALDRVSDQQASDLVKKRRQLLNSYKNIFKKNQEFVSAISSGTGDVKSVHARFSTIENLIKETLA